MSGRRCATLVACVAVLACGEGKAPEEPFAGAPSQLPDTTPVVPISQRQPTPLTERDVTRYLAALEELRRSESRVEADVEADTLGVVINEGALAASPAAQRIISRQGFRTLEEFHQVAYSIATALNAAPPPNAAEEMPLPDDPEERKALEEIRAAMGQFSSDQPPGNVELVTRYREQLRRSSGGQ